RPTNHARSRRLGADVGARRTAPPGSTAPRQLTYGPLYALSAALSACATTWDWRAPPRSGALRFDHAHIDIGCARFAPGRQGFGHSVRVVTQCAHETIDGAQVRFAHDVEREPGHGWARLQLARIL